MKVYQLFRSTTWVCGEGSVTTNGTGTRQRWLVRCSDSLELLLRCTDQGKAFRNDFRRRIFARYGYTPTTIWMDNLYCYGTEDRLDVRPPSKFRTHSTEICLLTLTNLIYGTVGMQI